jgi:hypothetical protein
MVSLVLPAARGWLVSSWDMIFLFRVIVLQKMLNLARSMSVQLRSKNAELSKKYECTITVNDKKLEIKEISVGPIGQVQVPPTAVQPNGPPLETADNRIRSSVWSMGKLWVSFNDRCYFKPNPDRRCSFSKD